MAIERQFLGWDRSALDSAADFLVDRYASPPDWDLGGVIVAVPGRRAGRLLLAKLALRATGRETGAARLLLTPPDICTVGALPERLYAPKTPIATNVQCLLARAAASAHAGPGALTPLIGKSECPAPEDLNAWTQMARDLGAIADELASAGKTFADVVTAVRDMYGETDVRRWEVLEQIEAAASALLSGAGLHTRAAARHSALAGSALECERDIVVLAAADMPDVVRAILRHISSRVTALIFAPDRERDAFDDAGCLITDNWIDRPIDIADGVLRFEDDPDQQARESVRTMRCLPDGARSRGVTVGLGDEAAGPQIVRALASAGWKARMATGRPVLESGPAQLLAAIGGYLEERRFDRFAILVRHADLDSWFDNPALVEQTDEYLREHLPARIPNKWPAAEASSRDQPEEALPQAAAKLDVLVDSLQGKRHLADWSRRIADVLTRAYADRSLDPADPGDADTIAGLSAIGEALSEQAAIDPAGALSWQLDAPAAVRFTLRRLTELPLPDADGDADVELLGWLELPLDDAQTLVVAGFNEGCVPRSVVSDAFLPDSLRSRLGIVDNARRYARDAYALTAILNSRTVAALICPRRTHDGDPVLPSRLLFACDDCHLIARAEEYGKDAVPETAQAGLPEEALEAETVARIPAPMIPSRPIDRLNVTAFKDYIASPYRFYLKHILKLEHIEPDPVEADGRLFGTLAHAALAGFGRSAERNSTDPETIKQALYRALEIRARTLFTGDRSVELEEQLRQLRRRLAVFAERQAGIAAAGWASRHIEHNAQWEPSVDEERFVIYGRIDRIDFNEMSQQWRLIDYKTSKTAVTPEEAHRRGPQDDKRWIDLQLPLYNLLVPSLGIDPGTVEVGYFNIPADSAKCAYTQASWSETDLSSAQDLAFNIIRAIRKGEYTELGDPASWPDGFERICLDTYQVRPTAADAMPREVVRGTAEAEAR